MVKVANDDEEDQCRLLQEAAIIGQFRHGNIIRLCGVVSEGTPVRLVRNKDTDHDY